MRRTLYFVSVILVLLLIGLIYRIKKIDSESLFICNLEQKDDRVLFYISDSSSVIDVSRRCYVRVNNNSDEGVLLPVDLSGIEKDLFLLDSCYLAGSLFTTNLPIRGFKCYYSTTNDLIFQYSSLSDCIYIPNDIVTPFLVPIIKTNWVQSLQHIFKSPSRIMLYSVVDFMREHCYRLRPFSDVLVGNSNYSFINTPAIVYLDDKYSSISLLYYSDGFQFENNQIIQYPIVIKGNRTFEGDVLYSKGGQSVIRIKDPSKIRIKIKKGLIKVEGGYLKYLSKNNNNDFLYNDILLEENLKANRLIRDLLLSQ